MLRVRFPKWCEYSSYGPTILIALFSELVGNRKVLILDTKSVQERLLRIMARLDVRGINNKIHNSGAKIIRDAKWITRLRCTYVKCILTTPFHLTMLIATVRSL